MAIKIVNLSLNRDIAAGVALGFKNERNIKRDLFRNYHHYVQKIVINKFHDDYI